MPHGALTRTGELDGQIIEGIPKLSGIQSQIGRRPVFAGGNSPGDSEMLDWVATGPGPTLAIVIDHDDGEREFAYPSVAGTFESDETMTEMSKRKGWCVVSMYSDWEMIFPPASRESKYG